MNIHQMIERSAEYDADKLDFACDAASITWDSYCRINIPADFGNAYVKLGLTDHAFRQACSKLGNLPSGYLNRCNRPLRSLNMSYWQAMAEGKWFVRAYKESCRAVLSEGYIDIGNTTVLEKVADVVSDVEHRLDGHVGADNMHAKFEVSDKDGGNYSIGFYVGNGETGLRILEVSPFIKRTSCDNSIIVQEGFRKKHIGRQMSDAYLAASIKEYAGMAIKLSDEYLERLVYSESINIPNLSEVVGTLCKDKGYSRVVNDSIMEGSEGSCTLWGLLMGISAAAKDFEYEQRIDMESYAGQILRSGRYV